MEYSFNELVELAYSTKDSRTHGWFLISSPVKVVMIIIAYLLLVLRIGPRFMKNRKAYDLKYTLAIYNLFQIIYNSHMFVTIGTQTQMIRSLMNDDCTIERGAEEQLECFGFGWMFLINKLFDLLDTIFMVLRKKQDQVNFLHLYHHSSMVLLVWSSFKYLGIREEFGIVMTINSGIHVVMYFYYLVAAMGPSYQKYLWWKIYITRIQIGQFLVPPLYMIAAIVRGCRLPSECILWIYINAVVFILLFVNFYRQTYTKSSKIAHKNGSVKKCEKST
uniref:Elongation of very long chain fatty acids protein n=1 Tax=Glossina brevipalpis TaxID=37001 RepID=A0A1A9X125_9MUSC